MHVARAGPHFPLLNPPSQQIKAAVLRPDFPPGPSVTSRVVWPCHFPSPSSRLPKDDFAVLHRRAANSALTEHYRQATHLILLRVMRSSVVAGVGIDRASPFQLELTGMALTMLFGGRSSIHHWLPRGTLVPLRCVLGVLRTRTRFTGATTWSLVPLGLAWIISSPPN